MNENDSSTARRSGTRRNPPRARRRRIPRRKALRQKRKETTSKGWLKRDNERRRNLRKSRGDFKRIKKHVFGLFSRGEVDELARKTGFYKRCPRQIPAFEFAVCCALASLVEAKRGFASVWRMLSAAAGINVARSAVTQRFGAGSAAMMAELFDRAVERLPQWGMENPELYGKLDQFHRVLADDGCVVRLSPLLGKMFPATRTNKVDAALKVHARADLVHRFVVDVVVTGERGSERDVARDYEVQPDTLYVRDLGYTCYDDFAAIVEQGGHVLMRLKDDANPTVVHVRHGVRAPRSSEGMKLNDVDLTMCHDTFDIDAQFRTSAGPAVFRVVGHYNDETDKYHCYLTDLPADEFSVEELETLYSLRWVIELLFKLLKSSCHLDHVDTSDPESMRTHIYASLLASIILSSVVVAASEAYGVPAYEISMLTVGIAAPLIVLPLLFMWLERRLTYDELSAMILRVVSHGCHDQNPGRTRRKWGALS